MKTNFKEFRRVCIIFKKLLRAFWKHKQTKNQSYYIQITQIYLDNCVNQVLPPTSKPGFMVGQYLEFESEEV